MDTKTTGEMAAHVMEGIKETILGFDIVQERSRSARQEMENSSKTKEYVSTTATDYERINNLYKQIVQEYVAQAKSARVFLFDWNDVPENGTGNLKEFLIHKFKADWVKSANVVKSNDGKEITISDGERSILLKLSGENIKLKLPERLKPYMLSLKRENGNLKVYAGVRAIVNKKGYGPKFRHVMNFICEHATYNEKDIQEFAGRFVGTELK